ncbi:hypothetical protein UA75_31300 (plasmid) [Actinoalloteichus sp. GBA129-24]|nr:hypothetical protein UA75_14820 [Actinoalloteichus sp. GBA129-24]APU24223.1 hypothetical protein UA75_31300 [Actinoalloteichus sp. GBA129-24]
MNFDEHETAATNAMSTAHPDWEARSTVLAMLGIGAAIDRPPAATERLAEAQEDATPPTKRSWR